MEARRIGAKTFDGVATDLKKKKPSELSMAKSGCEFDFSIFFPGYRLDQVNRTQVSPDALASRVRSSSPAFSLHT